MTVLLSPPLRYSGSGDLRRWADSGKPLVALVPEHDDYLQPTEARDRFAVVPQAVVGVDGAKHLWVGHAERALDEITAWVAPEIATPLPRTLAEPMERADPSNYADRTVAAYDANGPATG